MTVAIVDLGCGNVGSVAQALDRLGAKYQVTRNERAIAIAHRVILPGVGAAGFAMRRIDELGLRDVLTRLRQPVLGICLGMHLLFERSEEGDTQCLGILGGTVRKLEPAKGLPVPHMGWSKLTVQDDGLSPSDGDYVYFAHSYACNVGTSTAATANYGRPIAAAVRHENWTGVQFHPERSGAAGQRLLERFLA